jgi:hypothetical protein
MVTMPVISRYVCGRQRLVLIVSSRAASPFIAGMAAGDSGRCAWDFNRSRVGGAPSEDRRRAISALPEGGTRFANTSSSGLPKVRSIMEKQTSSHPGRSPASPAAELRLSMIQVAGGDAAVVDWLRAMIWDAYCAAACPFGATEDGMSVWWAHHQQTQRQ